MTFCPAYQHQGYARVALRAVLAVLCEQLAHDRLTAVVDTRHTGACQLLARLGLHREKHYRLNRFLKGECCDAAPHGLLRSA
ncbi:hypothetical protein CSC88_25480 [Klebsiella pneumoniae]|nr:hypothetical protein CSC88_25480 [Klebsiella pneumoniae]